jgi:hypothetical protein
MSAPRPIRHQARRRHGGNDGGVRQGRTDQPLTVEANELGAVAAVEPREDRAHQQILGSQSKIKKNLERPGWSRHMAMRRPDRKIDASEDRR